VNRNVILSFASFCAAAIFMTTAPALPQSAAFGPSNPFYAPSTLPFHAPPFDKIRDSDYQPAIEAGMAQPAEENLAIADTSYDAL
jgi:peptidyl-dipeptidase Dcp